VQDNKAGEYMKLKQWIHLLGWVLTFLIVSTQVYAEGTSAQNHQNWNSRAVKNDGVVAFRALTTFTEPGTSVILTIDRFSNDCSIQYISMNVVLPEPAQKTFDSKPFFETLRIDEAALRNINYTVSAKAGENIAFVRVTNFDKGETLLEEFIKGRTLRFKLALEKSEIYFRFSLLGFTAASTRALELCSQFNSDKSDKQYFSDIPKIKLDKHYF